MRALILAAGLGSRLRPLTEDVPKPLVNYKGNSLLKHQINSLRSNNINELTIVTGYLSDKLVSFLKEFDDMKIDTIFNPDYSECSSAFSAYLALKDLDEDYIHINCDVLFNSQLLKRLLEDSRKNILCVRSDLVLTDSMENAVGINGRLVNMSLRPSNEAKFKAFGLAKISKEALKENLKFYSKFNNSSQRAENYYGLIRMNLGNEDYFYIETDKKSLSEINSMKDLQDCEFVPDLV